MINALETFWTQNAPLTLGICFIFGLFVGAFYFWTMYRSIEKLSLVKNKKTFLFLTALARIGVFFVALVLVANKDILRILLFFVGFMLARILIMVRFKKNLLKSEKEKKNA